MSTAHNRTPLWSHKLQSFNIVHGCQCWKVRTTFLKITILDFFFNFLWRRRRGTSALQLILCSLLDSDLYISGPLPGHAWDDNKRGGPELQYSSFSEAHPRSQQSTTMNLHCTTIQLYNRDLIDKIRLSSRINFLLSYTGSRLTFSILSGTVIASQH